MAGMQTWKCPKCGDKVTVRGSTEVAHRCPAARQNALVQYLKETISE